MAYSAYLIKRFDHTHENLFFRIVSTQLNATFGNTDGLHTLIGNVSCNGHQIDALFISSGKIIVIDFKNYGGALTFSENNPWSISSGEDFVYVAGGGNIRNPYQQVNAYRHSLKNFLSNKQNELLEANHEINFGHIAGLVLFHQPITLANTIPQNISVYFDIADSNTYIATITDRNSAQLVLSGNEIEKIQTELGVRMEHLYEEANGLESPELPVVLDAVGRLALAQKILAKVNVGELNSIQKLVVYYQTLIDLERQKEPNITAHTPFHIVWSTIEDTININIEHSPRFHQLFQQNRTQRFPKNIFIGVNVSFNNQNLPLLHTIIRNGDILNPPNISATIEELTLYTRPLEDRNYPDDLLAELDSAVNQQDSIQNKTAVLNNLLGGVQLADNITLAFSEENPFTSQLYSELRKINTENLVQENSLLNKFLLKKEIPNTIQEIPASEFIQISSLNAKQKEAVRIAFNQPLSVITGPPGTGKTQVVLNILANAIRHNKKVLLASKNNKAVDNVKERLRAIIQEPRYFLRFGSQNEIIKNTNPEIAAFVARIHHNNLEDNVAELTRIENEISNKKAAIAHCNAQLARKIELERNIVPNQSQALESQKKYYEGFLSKESPNIYEAETIEKLKIFKSEYIKSKNGVLSKYSGINRFWFDLFSKKKYAVFLLSSFESWSSELRQLAETQNIKPSLSTLKNGDAIISACSALIQFIENGLFIIDEKVKLDQEIQKQKALLSKAQEELRELSEREEGLKTEIVNMQNAIDSLGIPLINEEIHKKIRTGDAISINRYKEYIPNNIPWQWQGIPAFINTTKNFLDTFNITATSSLSIKNAFPLTEDLFDIVVIDEASQCDTASALPLILRAKQLVVIGDPMQLKHISKVQRYEERYIQETLRIDPNLGLDYVNKSLYDYCYDLSITSRSRSVFLQEHFRCHPQIIKYSNDVFYEPKMGQKLDIKTATEHLLIEPKGIFWKNIRGNQDDRRKSNQLECNSSIDLALRLAEQHPDVTIGITTPFRDQAIDISTAIPAHLQDRITAAVVHSFQGDEKDIMIFSLVVTQNSPMHLARWINDSVPFLINVAVTRARNTLYVVGNADYCRQLPADSPLRLLVNYIDGINPIAE